MCCVQLLWRFNKEATHLRVQHHITCEKGLQAHTVFVRDIPGIQSGTIVDRIDSYALRWLPGFIKVGFLLLGHGLQQPAGVQKNCFSEHPAAQPTSS